MGEKIDIGVACGPSQSSLWWASFAALVLRERENGHEIGQFLTVNSALPDFNKCNSVGGTIQFAPAEEKGRNEKTDANRVVISRRFLSGDPEKNWRADWIVWIDDDVIPPNDFITLLLKRKQSFVAGLYFNSNPPFNPIAYYKNKGGVGYSPLYDYPPGSILQVDSVGMGCTLIHREVYEKIMETHTILVRSNGSVMPVFRSKLVNANVPFLAKQAPVIEDIVVSGWHCQRVSPPDPDDNRAWPFYSMEYGRTEDHHFCELAEAAGYKPWVDTRIVCSHLKLKATTEETYKDALYDRKSSGTR